MRRPVGRWLLFPTAGLLLLTAVPAAPAQPKTPSTAFLEGTEVFRRILFELEFHPLSTFDDLEDDPRHKILVVLGDAHRLTEVPGGLKRFVDRGGALFLATDRKLDWEASSALAQTTGVEVKGQSVVCDDNDSCYHQLAYCPFLQRVGNDPDLFRNLTPEGSNASNAATNAPSYLLRAPGNFGAPFLPPLAALPPKCYPEGAPAVAAPGLLRPFNLPPVFAVGGDVGANGGRALVMADHSVFINAMMLPEDEGNVEFTYNCLEWLRGDDKNPRTSVLFLEEGTINTRFEVPLKDSLPDEVVDRILGYLAQHIDLVEKAAKPLEHDLQRFDERDGVNREFLRFLRRQGVSPDDLLRILAIVLAVLVVLYGCYKVGWRARHRSDLQGPLLASALYRLAPVGSVADQRQRALVWGDNLYEPARDLARQCLAEAGAPAAKGPPRVTVQGGWLRRWTMAGRVKRLWRLAYGPPARVSRGEWPRLLRQVRELKTALKNGTVRFT